MQTTKPRNILAQTAFALFVGLYAFAPVSNAGVINHGMFMGPNVMYLDVTETSSDPVPLYGAPITIGDSLAFFEPSSSNPSLGFSAQAGGGLGDLTDGFLNLTIMSKSRAGISEITFSEGGDYKMSSLGNALAKVEATLNIFELRIVGVDGSPVSPIVLSDIQNATFELPSDPASGIWNLSSTFDLEQALDDANQAYTSGVTKLTARINNTLTALTQPGSVAGIFKKDFDIDTEIVPEPTSMVLAFFGLVGALASLRKS